MHEIIIVGAGPAGLTAALYAARAGARSLVLERAGGQLTEASEIENYPGIMRISGTELQAAMREQAVQSGAEFIRGAAKRLERIDGGWRVVPTRGEPLEARAVIAATGASRRRLGIPGERELVGAGVSYCAVCDGAFFKGRDVAVVGGGDAAVEDALYLSGLCRNVYLVHRRETFRASGARLDRVRAAANITLCVNCEIERIEGDGVVSGVVLRRHASAVSEADGTVAAVVSNATLRSDTARSITNGTAVGEAPSINLPHAAVNEALTLPVAAVFIAIGTAPNTAWLDGAVPLDSGGYAACGEDCRLSEGLWVAGDIRRKPLRQIATAVADGAVAGKAAAGWVAE